MLNRPLVKYTVCVGLALGWAGNPLASGADKQAFETLEQKAGYIIGTQIGGRLTQQGVTLDLFDVNAFVQGVREAIAAESCAFDPNEQRSILRQFSESVAKANQAKQEATLGDSAWKTKLTKPEMMTFDAEKDYFWILDTNKGKITVKFMPDVAPMHVTSTIFLTNKGFYDNLTFHRVIPGFMAQGGCPLGTGTGGPGYNYGGEIDPNVKHDRPYLLSMANTGRPNTDGSQFFLTFKATPWLDGKHTIFGEITEGKEVMQKLEAAGTQSGKTKEKLFIKKASIEEKPKG